jgi:hypothetical protein
MEEKGTNNVWRKPLIIIVVIGVIAFGLMVLMMVVPKTKMAVSGDLQVEYTPDKDGYEYTSHLIPIKVIAPAGVERVVLYYGGKEGFRQKELALTADDSTWYVTSLELPEKGIRTYYYFEVSDRAGNKIILPEKATPEYGSEYQYFKLRSEGQVSRPALYFHVLLMLFAIVLFFHVLYDALYILNGGHRERRIVLVTLYAQICFFITGFPLGWIIEKQALGNYWEGIPFGWDITDSKTLFIFLYWMIPLILYWMKKIGERGFAKWAVGGVLFTVAMFLLPHSL